MVVDTIASGTSISDVHPKLCTDTTLQCLLCDLASLENIISSISKEKILARSAESCGQIISLLVITSCKNKAGENDRTQKSVYSCPVCMLDCIHPLFSTVWY